MLVQALKPHNSMSRNPILYNNTSTEAHNAGCSGDSWNFPFALAMF